MNFKFTKTGKHNTYERTYFLMVEQPRYKTITIQKKKIERKKNLRKKKRILEITTSNFPVQVYTHCKIREHKK
jgi:hypothetical protein